MSYRHAAGNKSRLLVRFLMLHVVLLCLAPISPGAPAQEHQLAIKAPPAAKKGQARVKEPEGTSGTRGFSPIPLGSTRRVSLLLDEKTFPGWSDRQLRDQARDWLLLISVSASGLSPVEINQATYDLPPVRYTYLQPVANFEYGKTRFCPLGRGQVLALVPADEPQERMDYLAHIADAYRKNTGAIPTTIRVFEYTIDLEQQSARLKHAEDKKGIDLFTAAAGYHQAQIRGLSDLEAFLSRVNDLTFAEMRDGNLLIGGRAVRDYPEHVRIRTEHVATLWQSEKKIASRRDAYRRLNAIDEKKQALTVQERALQKRVQTYNDSAQKLQQPQYARAASQAALSRKWDAFYNSIARYKSRTVRGTGYKSLFSSSRDGQELELNIYSFPTKALRERYKKEFNRIESSGAPEAKYFESIEKYKTNTIASRGNSLGIIVGSETQRSHIDIYFFPDRAMLDKSRQNLDALNKESESIRRRYKLLATEEQNLANQKKSLEKQYSLLEAQWRRVEHDEEAIWRLLATIQRETQNPSLALGSGFSLDPTYDHARLLRKLPEYEFYIRLALSPAGWSDEHIRAQIAHAKRGLQNKDERPLLRILDQMSRAGNPRQAREIFEDIRKSAGFQAARYDGSLRGTDVGMVLFYADLLAKLWALDYRGASPHHDEIASLADFLPPIAAPVSSVFRRNIEEQNNTRVWFGKDDRGFQLAGGGRRLYFARNAARLYAASSDSLNPDREGEPNAADAAFLRWWNDHYEEIARYEPQYERLNQIMKWSLLVTWLNQSGAGNRLSFLQVVPVTNSHWFPEWAAKEPDLRFRDWENLPFLPKNERRGQTEALKLMYSRFFRQFGQRAIISGGVSLASPEVFEKRAPLTGVGQINERLRRSDTDYSPAKSSAERLENFGGASFVFPKGVLGITARPMPNAPLRESYGEMDPGGAFERALRARPGRIDFDLKYAGAEIGSCRAAEKTTGSFEVGWYAREVAFGHALARYVSRNVGRADVGAEDAKTILNDLLAYPGVKAAIYLGSDDRGGERYLVKWQNGKRWLELVLGSADLPPPASGPLPPPKSMPVAGGAGGGGGSISEPPPASGSPGNLPYPYGLDSLNIRLAWHDQSSLSTKIVSSRHVLITVGGALRTGIGAQIVPRGPPADAVPLDLTLGDVRLRGAANPSTAELFFPVKTLPKSLRADPARLAEYLTPAYRDELVRRLKSEPPPMRIVDKRRTDYQRLQAALGQANLLLQSSRFAEATAYLNELAATYAADANALDAIRWRRIAASVGRGNLEDAAQALSFDRPTPDASAFLNEIEARIAVTPEGLKRKNLAAIKGLMEAQENAAAFGAEGEIVVGFQEDGTLVAAYRINGAPEYLPVDTVDEIPEDALIYLQAAMRRLLDRSAGVAIRPALQSPEFWGRLEIIKILEPAITEFRFDQIFLGKSQEPFDRVKQPGSVASRFGVGSHPRTVSYNRGAQEDADKWIYIVRLKQR